jgi:hypothetical protein
VRLETGSRVFVEKEVEGLRLFCVLAGNRRDAEMQVWNAMPQPADRAEPSSESNAVSYCLPDHSR